MEEKTKSPSFYVLNVGGLLLILSVVGSTLRFALISVTLISWLQTQWLAYTAALKRRHSARLAAAADQNQIRLRKQIADVSEAVGENVIALLDKRRRELVLKVDQVAERKRQGYKQDIVRRITEDLAEFQESERIKDEQSLTLREYRISQREKEVKDREEALQARQKTLDEREQRIKDSERALQDRQKLLDEQEQKARAAADRMRQVQIKQEEVKIQSRVLSQPATIATPYSAIQSSISPIAKKPTILPADLLDFADDLESSHFTCIGVTKKGTRCGQSMISNFDKSSASERIAKMVSPGPGDSVLFDMKALQELADWMLCPRLHRDTLQGAGIASRWYDQLSDARAQFDSHRAKEFKTPPSAGVPNIFGSASTGNSTGTTASSLGSSAQPVSMPYLSSNSQSMNLFGNRTTTSNSEQQLFGGSAARNLTPMFEVMSQARP
ncbi:uncharacterized protein BHQ10_003092 [Talaromyces amestolkiae]|uniref:Uncharacterized protein n=1 Tax=Talaromyces amestolkiae TaxID=1196081 RepID=A0A364KU47_TALAM|nr:uncharacterized protein BHQ10_003092 [Talaromyces amestolkiae]RAO67080.1 hypothetical protein BHQ10_003092 [Talaromyces amestolkiae]